MAYTILEKINIAKISEYLVGNDIQKKQLYGGGIDLLLHNKIYNIRKSVEYIYGIDPTNETLEQTSNYLLSLCVPYNLEAAYIMNNGSGGTVTPATPTGYQYTVLSFTVSANLETGIPANGSNSFQNEAFIGALQFAYIIVDNITESVQAGQVSLDSATGVLSRVNTFNTGEIVIVPFLKRL